MLTHTNVCPLRQGIIGSKAYTLAQQVTNNYGSTPVPPESATHAQK